MKQSVQKSSSGNRPLSPALGSRQAALNILSSVLDRGRPLDEAVYRIIREKRARREDSGDLLSMLLHAQDEDGGGMSDQQLRDEVMTFFFAGHETTAIALTWTFYLLAQHPEVEARLAREVAVLSGRPATVADLPRLAYGEWVVREAMRLYMANLKPTGILVIHISNQYLNLAPEVELLGESQHLEIRDINSPSNDERGEFRAEWVVMTSDPTFFSQPEVSPYTEFIIPKNDLKLWTDDYSSLLPLIRLGSK